MSILTDLKDILTPDCEKKLLGYLEGKDFSPIEKRKIPEKQRRRYLDAFRVIDLHLCDGEYDEAQGLPFHDISISSDLSRLACILATYRGYIPMVLDFNPDLQTSDTQKIEFHCKEREADIVAYNPGTSTYTAYISEKTETGDITQIPFTVTRL